MAMPRSGRRGVGGADCSARSSALTRTPDAVDLARRLTDPALRPADRRPRAATRTLRPVSGLLPVVGAADGLRNRAAVSQLAAVSVVVRPKAGRVRDAGRVTTRTRTRRREQLVAIATTLAAITRLAQWTRC
ncbi:hypothetical protein Scel_11540 [Streptomyces cellostaticus]|nr:hypothetical protein Scel_11540 [Streptomyces cellostaticus]